MQAMTMEERRWMLPVYPHSEIEPVRGEGALLQTRDGRTLIDFYGGHAVALLGYGHPRLVAALEEQAKTLFFQSNVVPLEVRARAARKLVEWGPEGLTRAFLVNSGAEANENALRLAFRRTGRRKVVAVEGAFHGRTAAAAAVTWGSSRWYGFPQPPFDVAFVPRGDLDALETALVDAAALIVEPVQGQAGAYEAGASWLTAARDLTRDAGTVMIFDEVQCGLGRSGEPFAAQAYGVTPDLLTTAKGLAGGFPAGAVLVSDELAEGLKEGDLGTTFGGGPLACALIQTVIDVIEEEGLLQRVRDLSQRILATCLTGPVTAIQGKGFLIGLRTTRPAKEIQAELIEHGIVSGTSGDPHIVRLLPPLVLEASHVDALAAALAEIRP
ncbi:MAG TPA: aminotransferase class III-fold pyridoxal phosphate-dependent enzyme [Thermoanaerobaculia bacterium]|jgi:acetylornithine/succinyldiaminopimelate/putrescine aminotransferase|nr:aminotransferase class III-fold pyridoxal phosphate-dependent enzyme [Thermoanaerobaculia bacterium]